MTTIRNMLIGLIAVLGLVAAAGSANAAPVQPAATAAHASFAAVSCPSASFCLAVGSHLGKDQRRLGLAEKWNGKAWRVVSGTPGSDLQFVSCTSSSFCMATGTAKGRAGNQLMAIWNGRAWRTHAAPNSDGEISCGSPKLCMSINDSAEDIDYWSGKAWRVSPGSTSICGGPDCNLEHLSCGGPSNCMVVGTIAIDNEGDGFLGQSARWNGRRWGGETNPSDLFDNVTCSRRELCMTVGDMGVLKAWRAGKGWFNPVPSCSTFCGFFPPMSCGGLTFCVSISFTSTSATNWSGTSLRTVKLAKTPGTTPALSDVSCATSSVCFAVGVRSTKTQNWALAERWNGRSWRVTKTALVS